MSLLQRTVAISVGSNFVCGGAWISPTLVLTAAHCLKPNAHIVTFDSKFLNFEKVKADHKVDLAVVKVRVPQHHGHFPVAPPGVSVGDPITIVSHANSLDWTMRKTFVTAIRPFVGINTTGPYLQIQDSIVPGESGSPVINESNQLTGVVSFALKDKPIGFAVQVSSVTRFLDDVPR